jgi:hypothetical protein
MNDLLAKFATENPDYRKALLKDPKAVIQEQFQVKIPDRVNVKVVQETSDTSYVILPQLLQAGAQLSDSDLEAVAGGFLDKTANCEEGLLSTVVEINASLF